MGDISYGDFALVPMNSFVVESRYFNVGCRPRFSHFSEISTYLDAFMERDQQGETVQ